MDEALLEQVLVIENASYPRPWTRQHFLDELSSPHAVAMVAVTPDAVVAGYFCCRLVADEAELLDIAVAPAFRRCGVGAQLLHTMLDCCRARGITSLGLEVRASNQAAINLYRRFGFLAVGTRRRYYENSEDALLMQLDISENEETLDAVQCPGDQQHRSFPRLLAAADDRPAGHSHGQTGPVRHGEGERGH